MRPRIVLGRKLTVASAAALAAIASTGALAPPASAGSASTLPHGHLVPSHHAVIKAGASDPTAGDQWFWKQRIGAQGSAQAYAHRIAAAHVAAQQLPGVRPHAAGSASWTSIGPTTITDNDPNGNPVWGSPYAGRVTALALGSSPGTLYAGSAGGGLWVTTTNGQSWTPLTDSQPSLVVGSLVLDSSTTPPTIYVGTGEGGHGADAGYGQGILVSSDNGQTWSTLPGSSIFAGNHVGSLAVTHPTAGSTFIYAGSNLGLYLSTDGGTTFNQLSNSTTEALAVAPGDSSTVYGVQEGVGVIKATNANTASPTFATLGGGLPGGSDVGLSALAIAPSNPGDVYVSISCPNQSCANGSVQGALDGFYASSDGGTTWTASASAPDYLGGQLFYGSPGTEQGWYDNALAVSPTSPTTVVAAGLGVVMTTDGGTTWVDVNDANDGNPMHPDTHALAFDTAGDLYVGNDGGVYEAQSPGPQEQVSDLNSNLVLTQFYPGFSQINGGATILAGAQDNGTPEYGGTNAWTIPSSSACGGDGAGAAINPLDPNEYYCIADQQIASSNASVTSPQNGGANWVMPLALVPNQASVDSPTLYLGADHVYVSNDGGVTWTATSSYGTGGANCTACVSAIAVAPSNPQVVYAGWGDGTVQVSQDGGSTWNTIPNIVANDAGSWVTKIAVSPTDPGTIFVTYSGNIYPRSSPSAPNVAEISSATGTGATFVNITGNLPNAPTNSVAINGTALDVGTDVGVFTTVPSGTSTSWSRLGTDLANAPVTDLAVTSGGVVIATTYGRGAWELSGGASSVNPTSEQDASTVAASPTSVPADGTSNAIVTVTLQANGAPVAGASVTLSQGSGSSAIDLSPALTNASGVATYQVSDHTAETVTYTATDTTNNVTLAQTATVTFSHVVSGTTGPTSPTASTMGSDSLEVPPDGISNATITVNLVDANGNPEVNHTVTLTQGSGSSTIAGSSSTTNANGTSTFTVSDTKTETVTYTAKDTTDSVSVSTDVTVNFAYPHKDGSTPPNVTQVSPSTGSTNGGTAITISGQFFTGTSQVVFGTAPAASFHVVSDTRITAFSPAESAAQVDVRVTTPSGTSEKVAADHFTFTQQAAAGYWMLGSDGTVYPFGAATNLGSATSLASPAAGMAATPDGQGYWVAAQTGAVQAFGDAPSLSPSSLPSGGTIVTIAGTPDGKGYWLASDRGQVVTAGDAQSFGDLSNKNLNSSIVDMAVTPDGKGYWLLGGDGGVFTFGDAGFFGSTGNITLNQPAVAMAPTADGRGYWFVAGDGGLFAFGDAGFYGSTYQLNPAAPAGGGNSIAPINKPVNGIVVTSDGSGYWMVAADGGVFAFGDAGFVGSLGANPPANPIVGFAAI